MWEDILKSGRPQLAIWRMRIELWIPEATKIQKEYCNTYCFPTATMVEETRLIVTLYVHYVPCLLDLHRPVFPTFSILSGNQPRKRTFTSGGG